MANPTADISLSDGLSAATGSHTADRLNIFIEIQWLNIMQSFKCIICGDHEEVSSFKTATLRRVLRMPKLNLEVGQKLTRNTHENVLINLMKILVQRTYTKTGHQKDGSRKCKKNYEFHNSESLTDSQVKWANLLISLWPFLTILPMMRKWVHSASQALGTERVRFITLGY